MTDTNVPNTPGLVDLGGGMMAPSGSPITWQPSSLLLPPDATPTTEQIQQTGFYGTSAWDPNNGLRVFEANGERVFAAVGFNPAQLPVGAVELPSGVGGLPAPAVKAPVIVTVSADPTPVVSSPTPVPAGPAVLVPHAAGADVHESLIQGLESHLIGAGRAAEAEGKALLAKLRNVFAAAKAKL
jgi:hypothetical protein